MESIDKLLEFEIAHIGKYHLRVYSIIIAISIYLITKLILWLLKKAIYRKEKNHTLNQGNAYAIFQIMRYIIWVVAFSLLLETFDIKVTVLLASSAALLVGIGFGLQQIFNDIISGLILLSEKSIKIEDILEVDGDIVKIQRIGLRTSTALSRNSVSIILPNSSITSNKVINWSHQSDRTRFTIDIGVAYGSDMELVSKLLTESTATHPDTDENSIDIRLTNFGNSTLDFQILFYSNEIFRIEKVKSDIRFNIERKFREHNVSIPFPQMDVYLKS